MKKSKLNEEVEEVDVVMFDRVWNDADMTCSRSKRSFAVEVSFAMEVRIALAMFTSSAAKRCPCLATSNTASILAARAINVLSKPVIRLLISLSKYLVNTLHVMNISQTITALDLDLDQKEAFRLGNACVCYVLPKKKFGRCRRLTLGWPPGERVTTVDRDP